jgi:hypothetical protein
MRHLLGYLWLSSALLGCSFSTVGSMDPVEGGRCEKTETKKLADGCTLCTCDGKSWSCDDAACNSSMSSSTCTPGATKPQTDGCGSCACSADGAWKCDDQPCPAKECQPGDTKSAPDGCGACSCSKDATWECDPVSCPAPACQRGETKLGPGGCYRCSCDASGNWDCPDIECTKCQLGETTHTDCLDCVCNEQGTWTCSGFLDGNCGGSQPPTCLAGFGDCDGDPANGCEAPLDSSSNCGACGNVCLSPAGVMGLCSAGECDFSVGGGACRYLGVDQPAGSSFPARDGCNVCKCVRSSADGTLDIACTDDACGCNSDTETYRHYLGTSPDACSQLSCPDHTTAFSNTCGCGCEQSTECPNSSDCDPNGADMLCAYQALTCPYLVRLPGSHVPVPVRP